MQLYNLYQDHLIKIIKNLSNDISTCILNVYISDHQPGILLCNDEVPLSRTKYTTIAKSLDKTQIIFCQTFQKKQLFEKLDNNNDDPNHNYQILEGSLIDSHKKCLPTRVVKFNCKRHKISPWMTNGSLKSINHRNRLYKNHNSNLTRLYVHWKTVAFQ